MASRRRSTRQLSRGLVKQKVADESLLFFDHLMIDLSLFALKSVKIDSFKHSLLLRRVKTTSSFYCEK